MLETYAPGQSLVAQHLDAARSSVEDQEEDHQASCSSSGGGVGAAMAGLVVVCASDSALAFGVPQPPLLRSFGSGLSGDTTVHQCYEQKEGTAAL